MRLLKNIILIFSISTVLTSCFYSTKYIAKYNISPTKSNEQTILDIRETINNLSQEYNLMVDNKFSQTDTLGYFGDPYHYFKFWTSSKDSIIRLNLDYHGQFGKRKSPPYDTFLSQLTVILNQNFSVTLYEVDEKSNRKNKSRKSKTAANKK
jgi:hypothetical protein